MKLRIAGAQVGVTGDSGVNVRTLLRAIDFAADEHAEILLTPEGSLSGYTPQFDPQTVHAGLEAVTARARAAHVGLALGTCYLEDDGRTYNQIRFYAPDGAFLGFHSKTLTCGTLTDPPQGEIRSYAVRPLRTYLFQGITVGGLICNDLWANPTCTPQPDTHLAQQLARLGARIIFHAVNGGRDGSELSLHVHWPYHESNLRLRAMAARTWIVTVDNCAPVEMPCSAPGGVLSPRGEWMAKAASQGEQFFAYTIEEN